MFLDHALQSLVHNNNATVTNYVRIIVSRKVPQINANSLHNNYFRVLCTSEWTANPTINIILFDLEENIRERVQLFIYGT